MRAVTFQIEGEAGLTQAMAGTEAGEIAQARPCGLSRLSRRDHGLNGAGESDGPGQEQGKATRFVIEINAATAASARASGWCVLCLLRSMPGSMVSGSASLQASRSWRRVSRLIP